MDKGECRGSKEMNYGTFIIFDFYSLQSTPKLFAGDTSLFATAQDIITSTVSLNNDFREISK